MFGAAELGVLMSRITHDPDIAHEWQVVGDIIVTRTADEIPDAQWDPFIERISVGDIARIFSLVVGPATITATQRKGAAETFKTRGIEATVITDNRMTRGILTALSWLGAHVKGFRWTDLEPALANLGATGDERDQLAAIAERCRQEVM